MEGLIHIFWSISLQNTWTYRWICPHISQLKEGYSLSFGSFSLCLCWRVSFYIFLLHEALYLTDHRVEFGATYIIWCLEWKMLVYNFNTRLIIEIRFLDLVLKRNLEIGEIWVVWCHSFLYCNTSGTKFEEFLI